METKLILINKLNIMIHEYELEKIWKNNLNEFAGIMRLDSIIIRAMKEACIEQKKEDEKEFQKYLHKI